jgi:hypothetical protein
MISQLRNLLCFSIESKVRPRVPLTLPLEIGHLRPEVRHQSWHGANRSPLGPWQQPSGACVPGRSQGLWRFA